MFKSLSLTIVLLLVICCFEVAAQPLPPDPVAAVPLDGFSLLLLAGGAAAAATQLKDKEE